MATFPVLASTYFLTVVVLGDVLCAGSKLQSNVKNLFSQFAVHTENFKGLLGLKRNAKEKENVSLSGPCVLVYMYTKEYTKYLEISFNGVYFFQFVKICNGTT